MRNQQRKLPHANAWFMHTKQKVVLRHDSMLTQKKINYCTETLLNAETGCAGACSSNNPDDS